MSTPQTTGAPAALTGDAVIDGMTSGYRWSLGPDHGVDWSFSNGFSGEFWYNPTAVKEHIELAFDVFSYYANVKFNYSGFFDNPSAASAAGAEINVSMDGKYISDSSIWAIGLFPSIQFNSVYFGAPGDIYLNINSSANYLRSYDPGSIGWALLLHEIGHTLGLKHPHDDGGTGHPTFAQVGHSDLDTNLWTMMSYEDTYDWNQITWHPATPMILDVISIQYLYGKNASTNAGDSIYNLSETNAYVTIWDASGVDTLSLEGAASGWFIALPDTPISSLVDTKVGFALPRSDSFLAQPHTMDWLAGDYENVIGSPFADEIRGNGLGNSIFAGAGNDTVSAGNGSNIILGYDGDDSIVGGAGYDNVNGNRGSDTVDGGSGGNDFLLGGQGNDLMIAHAGRVSLNGNLADDTVNGGAGSDTVRGGQGNDLVNGGAGNDEIYGDRGNDTLTGGAGADTFHLTPAGGQDRVTDFNGSEGDRIAIDGGGAYTVSSSGADAVITLATGEQFTLALQASGMRSDWIITA